MRATLSFIKTKIISNENDKVGIVLYGVSQSGLKVKNENSLNFKNIHVLYSLDVPDAQLIKTIENKICNFTDDHGSFEESGAQHLDPTQINSCAVNPGSSLAATYDDKSVGSASQPYSN